MTAAGNRVTVLRPRYVSLSNKGALAKVTYGGFYRAALGALKVLPTKPDALYGHFISMAGLCAADAGAALGIPSYLAYGESSPKLFSHFSDDFIRNKLQRLSGVIAVSTKNRDELLGARLYDKPERVRVFPNAVNRASFARVDKARARKQLGIAQDAFVVAFCGSFIERKGVKVLCRAIDEIGGASSIFIGRGPVTPDCQGIAFQGALPHDQVPLYLSAADVFALPTLAEGCCNAIVEALCCGLPVVSSDLPFNDDVLNADNSLRVDPLNQAQLAGALKRLKEDAALRARLSGGALLSAENLTLPVRARNILTFMEEML